MRAAFNVHNSFLDLPDHPLLANLIFLSIFVLKIAQLKFHLQL